MRVRVHVHVCVCVCVRLRLRLRLRVCMFWCACVCVCACTVHVYVCGYACLRVCVDAWCTLTRAHIYTHTPLTPLRSNMYTVLCVLPCGCMGKRTGPHTHSHIVAVCSMYCSVCMGTCMGMCMGAADMSASPITGLCSGSDGIQSIAASALPVLD